MTAPRPWTDAGRIKIADCRRVVGTYYGVRKEAMLSERRIHKIAVPRMIAMALAHEMTGQSYPCVGFHFGGRDHTTVISAKKRVRTLSRKSVRVAEDIENFRLTLLTYKAQQGAPP
jgi:chromosomal replication initiator protein